MTDGIESAVNQAKADAAGKSVEVHGADTIQQCLMLASSTKSTSTSRRFFLAPEFDSLTTSPGRQPPWQPDCDPGRRRYTPALPGAQGVTN